MTMRLAAWLLFLLACALPSWYLRDIVAAEGQMRVLESTATMYLPRKIEPIEDFPTRVRCFCGRRLGPAGRERLWEVLSEGRDGRRRVKAGGLLRQYQGRSLTGWFIRAIGSVDPLMRQWAGDWAYSCENARDLTAYLRTISEEDFMRLLRSTGDGGTASLLIGCLWEVRPEEAERAGATWMRETTDPSALFDLSLGRYSVIDDGDKRSRFDQFMLKMQRAAEEDPRHAKMFPPIPPLRKPEEEHGTR